MSNQTKLGFHLVSVKIMGSADLFYHTFNLKISSLDSIVPNKQSKLIACFICTSNFCTIRIGCELKCDGIKQNQSEHGNIDFEIEPNKAENVFCFLLFLGSVNCSYHWNTLTNFNRVFCKM